MLQLGFVIAMVTGIHFVEAYLLNPAIYSAHLKLHPLLVISTLVVAEHSLGVWGLLLAGHPPETCAYCAIASCVMYDAVPYQLPHRTFVPNVAIIFHAGVGFLLCFALCPLGA